MRRLPLHPRLARVLVEAGGSERAAAACAVLAERRGPLPPDPPSTDSDVLLLVDRLDAMPGAVRRAAGELLSLARRLDLGGVASEDDATLRRALLAGFPDRVARRRQPRARELLLASGAGAVLARESGVRDGEFLVALELAGGQGREPLVRVASRVEPQWLRPTTRERVHRFDAASGAVRASLRETWNGLVLSESPTPAEGEEASRLLAEALETRGLGEEAEAIVRRARFAGVPLDVSALIREACRGYTRIADVDVVAALPGRVRRAIEEAAPEALAVPSGRRAKLHYREDGSVVAAVKLQELFGLSETPRLGPRREPVVFELLAPNGRPVQTTRDLRSFWETTYPAVRRELRGRYPRHPWPEDPWTAVPTHRTKKAR
jgi:ATP-dependent helicase HrpB